MAKRNLAKERQEYERMLSRFSDAEREHTRKHFEAVKTQAPEGCDTGRKVPAVKDHDCMYDAYDSDY